MVKFKVKPSQKENWRYIAFEIISRGNFSDQDIVKAVTSANLHLYGELGTSEENLWLIEFNPEKKQGILRCSHKAQQKVLAALTAITKINALTSISSQKLGDGQDVVFNVRGVSGTIKKANEKYF